MNFHHLRTLATNRIVILIFFLLAIQTIVWSQPRITDFNPKSGSVGTAITITGNNFSSSSAGNIVYFGAVKATIQSATSNSISVIVPAGASYQPISVTTGGLTGYSIKPFKVTFDPEVSTFAINDFPHYGGLFDEVQGSDTRGGVAADFDGDGMVDVAMPAYGLNQLSFYRNISVNDTIRFATRKDISTGRTPSKIEIADIDGDGKTDIVLLNFTDETLSIYRNISTTGNINFASRVDINIPNISEVKIADFNDDGRPDLVVSADLLTGKMIFIPNASVIGNIAFGSFVEYTLGGGYNKMEVDDINGDGKNDVVVVNIVGFQFLVLINTSSTSAISFSSSAPVHTNQRPYHITIVDLNDDGKKDIAIAYFTSSSFSVFKNTSGLASISFDLPQTYYLGVVSNSEISTADIDGDGKPDLCIGDASGRTQLFKNNSTSTAISFLPKVVYGPTANYNKALLNDFNNDSKPDILLVCQGTIRGVVLNNKVGSPWIDSFTPLSALLGTTVTIKGENFDQASAVLFGGNPAESFSVVNSSTITAVVAEGATGSVSISTSRGADSKDGFTYLGVPTITSFTPASGEIGTQVTINGKNFSGISAVKFGGVPASSFNLINNTTITAIIANGVSGEVSVTNTNGTGTLPGFTYLSPSITSFTPMSAGTGTPVIINGTNFLSVTSVSFGGVPATSFVVHSPTSITAVVSGGLSGKVSVTTASGKSELDGFVFTLPPPPVITSFTPQFGNVGTSVTIKGENFNNIPEHNIVHFGATRAIVSSASSNQLVVIVPKGSTFKPITVLNKSNNLAGSSASPFIVTHTTSGASLGEGNFTHYKNIGIAPGYYDSYIYDKEVTDLDGDGKPDILFSKVNNTIGYFKNLSSVGRFDFSTEKFIPGFNVNNPIINIADIDGDGKVDVVSLASINGSRLAIARNTSIPGDISFDTLVTSNLFSNSNKMGIGDLDNDGRPDIVGANADGRIITIVQNISIPGIVAFTAPFHINYNGFASNIILDDFNGDGLKDILVSNSFYGYAYVSVFKNTSVGNSISFAPSQDFPVGDQPGRIAVCDIDNDGKKDILASNTNSTFFSILRNTGTLGEISFAPKEDFSTTPVGRVMDITTADIDGDGKPDVIIGVDLGNGGSIGIFKNNSTLGVISLGEQYNFSDRIPWAVTVADMDGDDRADILGAYPTNVDTRVTIFKNNVTNLPVINSFNNNGTEGTYMVINGDNFTGTIQVRFGGVDAKSFQVTSDNVIEAYVSNGATGIVEVTNAVGTGVGGGFVYHNNPLITGFSPASGTVGDTITISGQNLGGTYEINFGGYLATSVIVVDSSTVKGVIRPYSGSGNIQIKTYGGDTEIEGFRFIPPPPTIFSITPGWGTIGTAIKISGTYLGETTEVSFGGVPAASFSVNDINTITAVLGDGASGEISVITTTGKDELQNFIFIPPPPVINSFSPMEGGTDTTITIMGVNFLDVSEVSFGGVPASAFNVINATTIKAIVANGASGEVFVNASGGVGRLAGFIYQFPKPQIISVTPISSISGDVISIKGKHFTGTTAVSFGGTPAQSFTVISDTLITAVVGTGSSGNILVTTPSGTVTIAGFKYIELPVIHSFAPISAKKGEVITINGAHLLRVKAVKLGNVSADNLKIESDSRITVTVGSGASGAVELLTEYGNTVKEGFTFIEALEETDSLQNEIEVRPNPASGFVTIEHPSVNKTTHITFYDKNGKEMDIHPVLANTNSTRVSLQNLPPGFYFVVWTNGNKRIQQKLIVR